MLTPQTLQKLQNEQKKLDEFIIQKKNLTDANSQASFIRTKIALLVEIGELANELKTFKHWKNQKDINWDKAKEELIDCFHFYLSWANSFGINFSDYQFCKLVPEPDFNELLLTFFSETEAFRINVPWNVYGPKLIANYEKTWEEQINKLNPEDKDYQKQVETFRQIKEEQKKITEKMGNNFLEGIREIKIKTGFYRWLIIFEELAHKLGMKNEEDIYQAYMTKNKINWERQNKNY